MRHGLLLRRRGGGRGSLSRVPQPGRPLGPPGALPLREQLLRHGHGPCALRVGDPPQPEGGELRGARLDGRRDGRAGGGARRDEGRGRHPRRQRTALPRAPDLPLPRALHVRSGALPREGRGRGLEEAGPHRDLLGAAAAGGLSRRRSAGRAGGGARGGARRGGGRGRGGRVRAGRGADALRLQRGGATMTGASATRRKLTYREAVREALREALTRDERVFLMGEDVGAYGGGFGVSRGLLEEFGPERIRDTPLSEGAFVGAGVGAALGGMRPIVEIMTVNFSLLALDQIVNNAATLLHMSGGQFNVPLVIRMTTGAGRQLACQHSHSLENWYAHVPGLKVLAPATIEDARGMLWPALEDPDPVVIFEHGGLYNLEGELGANVIEGSIYNAAVRRPGRDLSLITHGGSLYKTLEAAERLEAEGVSAEVLDLRSLRPLDLESIHDSVRRTHRVVVVDECWRTGGLAAEILASILEGSFYELDAPPARVCTAEVPIPYARHLEEAALPQVDGIVAAARGALGR
ncbi:MAG: alpha-ketoacid dehydrogenase subunit beta [Deltaproteobacteria bacterium]|nr:alpha-ketoacid dehydrogenase subunit beta [Deltaproteobacteria bacterium]